MKKLLRTIKISTLLLLLCLLGLCHVHASEIPIDHAPEGMDIPIGLGNVIENHKITRDGVTNTYSYSDEKGWREIREDMTTNENGILEVKDYSNELKVIQELATRPPNPESLQDAIALSKEKPIQVSMGGIVHLRHLTPEQIRKNIKAQILILETKKINAILDKGEARQQYEWRDHQLNDQIWHLDLEMAKLDPHYIPMRGEWSFGKHSIRSWIIDLKRLFLRVCKL